MNLTSRKVWQITWLKNILVGKKKIATDNLINEMQMQPTDAQVQDDAAQIEAKKSTEKSDSAMVIEKNC